MPSRPYFSVSRASFEKNAGYKSTVHALAELIDNSVEANASQVAVIIMIDQYNHLKNIAVIDNGDGMAPARLQNAVCEKAGSHLDRITSSGIRSRRKFGKYGVGLPKASISQANKFTVWSWTSGGASTAAVSGIDITDDAWITAGAMVDECEFDSPPKGWLELSGLANSEHGTMVLWEKLDGVTWARARWGKHSGLIPNLEFEIGRVYRKLIGGESPELTVTTHIVSEHFNYAEPKSVIQPNDPLYLEPGQVIPREGAPGNVWPPDDPMFDSYVPSEPQMIVEVPQPDGSSSKVSVIWRASLARKDVFARYYGRAAGDLRHGKHALRNVGLSILREGREVMLSNALSNRSEPRERWFGVEVNFPHELDVILGMTNNKQEYTRLERILRHDASEYKHPDETSSQCLERIEKEDPTLAICLRIAWRTAEIWREVKNRHLAMRVEAARLEDDESNTGGDPETPEDQAEGAATQVDPPATPPPHDPIEKEKTTNDLAEELISAGVPTTEADQLAARIVDKGLSYAIISRPGLGSPFFNVAKIKGVRFLELNEDHPAHQYLRSGLSGDDSEAVDVLKERLANAKLATLLMLEAWAATELATRDIDRSESRMLQRVREDWGRKLEQFVTSLNQRDDEASDE